jgi:hypothetical protein
MGNFTRDGIISFVEKFVFHFFYLTLFFIFMCRERINSSFGQSITITSAGQQSNRELDPNKVCGNPFNISPSNLISAVSVGRGVYF